MLTTNTNGIKGLSSEGKSFFQYILNGETIGKINLCQHGKETGWIHNFEISTKFRRKGYGSKLLTHTIEYAKQQKMIELMLQTRVETMSFYTKFGFKVLAVKLYSTKTVKLMSLEL
jgi:ribosomal protein S18 acetylase RimI-like enzyme